MGLSDYWKDKKQGPTMPRSMGSPAAPSAPRGPTLPSSSSMLYPSSRGAGNSSPITAINRNSNGGWNMSDGSISLTASDGSTWNTGRHIQICYDSNNCASGWACIGGKCAQASSGASGSGGGTSGCGDDANNDDKCGSGDCTKSTCGESGGSPGDGTCCDGQKCCQRGDDGIVRCSCGPCPPPNPTCDAFCAAHYSAYGRLTMGCTEDKVCTQCEECRLVESYQPKQCVPLEPEDANCWCDQSIDDPPEECMKCMGTGGWEKDCENCQACYTVEVDCGCARNTQKCCEPGCITTQGQRSCIEKAWSNCRAACTPPDDDDDGPADPCAGECYGQHICDEPLPPCPDGASCTDNGSISAGGRTCYIRTVCDKTNVPEECKGCDCNCDNDCKNCEICNASGECVPDPECDDQWFYEVAYAVETCLVCNSPLNGCVTDSCPGGGRCTAIWKGTNYGIIGQDPMGLSWMSLGPAAPTTCDNGCTKLVDNGNKYVVRQPDGSTSGDVNISPRVSCSFQTTCFRLDSYGVVMGVGSTRDEALESARAQVDAIGC